MGSIAKIPTFVQRKRIAIAFGSGLLGTSVVLCENVQLKKDNNSEFADISHLQKWDSNWDGRSPEPESPKPRATRYIVLVRHGQYEELAPAEQDRILTSLGRQQGRILGGYLARMPWRPARLVVSDMPRAQQTFQLAVDALRQAPPPDGGAAAGPLPAPEVLPSLREGRPCQPIPFSKSGRYKKEQVERDGRRIDEAFRHLFFRADPSQDSDSYDLVVCHANVIRYFVCKSLQLPTEAWLRLSLPHCSITVLAITPSGNVVLKTYGNTHYLPPHMITTS